MTSRSKRPHRPVPRVSPEEAQELVQRAYKAIAEFEGQFDELENALGMLLVGPLVGWKVLLLIHNKRSIRKYEKILGDVNIREMFPEVGPLAGKSNAYRLAEALGKFWKAVSGEVKIDDRRVLDKDWG